MGDAIFNWGGISTLVNDFSPDASVKRDSPTEAATTRPPPLLTLGHLCSSYLASNAVTSQPITAYEEGLDCCLAHRRGHGLMCSCLRWYWWQECNACEARSPSDD
jgi:hypothetical protein